MTPTEPKPVASLAKFLNGTDNPPPALITRSKSKSIATRLALAAMATLTLLDPVPTRSRIYVGDATPGGRASFKANRRQELKARARRRGLRY